MRKKRLQKVSTRPVLVHADPHETQEGRYQIHWQGIAGRSGRTPMNIHIAAALDEFGEAYHQHKIAVGRKAFEDTKFELAQKFGKLNYELEQEREDLELKHNARIIQIENKNSSSNEALQNQSVTKTETSEQAPVIPVDV